MTIQRTIGDMSCFYVKDSNRSTVSSGVVQGCVCLVIYHLHSRESYIGVLKAITKCFKFLVSIDIREYGNTASHTTFVALQIIGYMSHNICAYALFISCDKLTWK